MERITVFLADDHTIVRHGLRALLDKEKDMEVVGEAENGEETVQKVMELRPSVVVMDIMMPQLDGLQATAQIVKDVPGVKVIVLSMYGDEDYVRRAINAGVKGYLVKSTAPRELLNAIREVNAGNAFFSPSIANVLLQLKQEPRGVPLLTMREQDVLQLICDGKSNKETADLLKISIKTVQKHRQQIMVKLNVHDAVKLVNYARGNKLVRTIQA
jgi:DNA-binding NarL/FixJ family response regulator